VRNKALLWGVFILSSLAFAQTSWWRTYGGLYNDEGNSVQQTSDGGYIIAGLTYSFGPGTPGWCNVYVVKTNAQGDSLWTLTCGGASADGGYSVQQTLDGGYIVAGFAASFGAGEPDVYLIKANVQGETLWTRTYGGTEDDRGYSVRQTPDGGYIIAGYTESFGAADADVYLIRVDAQGDVLWTRTYGGTGPDEGWSVQQTLDSGFVIAGRTWSFGAGFEDVYLIKTNALGDTLWTRTYGGTDSDRGSSVRQTSDGGYVISGETMSFGAGFFDIYVIRTNAQGDTLWTKTYGGAGYDFGPSVQQTSDGGYIIAGYTESFGAGDFDAYLIKTDGHGDTLWTRTHGGASVDAGMSVLQIPDGGYVIAGETYSFGGNDGDVWLIKTDANGNVGMEEPCARHLPKPSPQFLVQPNPFSSFARVPGYEGERFVLSDITGRQVGVCGGNRVGEGLGSGVYFLSFAVDKAHFPVRPVRIVKVTSR
jgi:hypothetical protein